MTEHDNNPWLQGLKKSKQKRNRIMSILLVLSMIVSTAVVLGLRGEGISMTGQPQCGNEEHVHDDSCYDKTLICTQPESNDPGHVHDDSCYEEQQILICGKEEGADENGEEHLHDETCWQTEKVLICAQEETQAAVHQHDDSCYQKTLTCTKEEHTHSDQCIPDETADTEKEADWKATFPTELPKEFDQKILALAQSQLGYQESSRNWNLNDQNERNGYTRYGAWAGAPYSEWNTVFVSFILHYAGLDEEACPYGAAPYSWQQKLQEKKIFSNYTVERDENQNVTSPKAADVVFFDDDQNGQADRSAFVKEIIRNNENKEMLRVIEADSNAAVEIKEYDLQDPALMGLVKAADFEKLQKEYEATKNKTEDSKVESTSETSSKENSETSSEAGKEEEEEPEPEPETKVLTGTVYYPVDGNDDMQPGAKLLLVSEEEDELSLLTPDENKSDIKVVEGVDENGVECVALEKEPDPKATPEELLENNILWQPETKEATTLSNVEDKEAVLDITEPENGIIQVKKSTRAALSSVNKVKAFAAAQGVPTCDDPCSLKEYLTFLGPQEIAGFINNPFGSASKFNLFLLEDLNHYGDTHGTAAIGGDILGYSGGVSYDDKSNQDYSANETRKYDVALLLGGEAKELKKDVVVRNGSVISQNLTGLDMADGDDDHFHQATQAELDAYFAQAKRELQASNSLLYTKFTDGSLSNMNGEVRYLEDGDINMDKHVVGYVGKDLMLKGTSTEYNIFNVPASWLSANGNNAREVYLDVPYGSYTVINVLDDMGGNVTSFAPKLRYRDSHGVYIDQPADKSRNDDYRQLQRTLINFAPSITQVKGDSQGLFIYASVLGPNVNMTAPDGGSMTLQGNIVLNSLSGNTQGEQANNSVIQNDFEISGSLEFNKYILCEDTDDEEHIKVDNCQIDRHNKNSWDEYLIDVRLVATDSARGSAKYIDLIGLKLDGTNTDKHITSPGVYRVISETIYRADDPEKTPVDIGHHFSGAYFISYMDTRPENSQDVRNNGSLLLNIPSEEYVKRTIVNLYRKDPVVDVYATKQFVTQILTDGKYQNVIITPPAGAKVTFALFKQRMQDGKPVGDKVQIGTQVLSADNQWKTVWSSLPKTETDENDPNITYDLSYSVDETREWDGYEKLDPECDANLGEWIIRNKVRKMDPGTLEVKKHWYNSDGSDMDPDRVKDQNVEITLFRQTAQVPEDLNRDCKVTFTLNGSPLYSKDVAKGSSLKLDLNYWVKDIESSTTPFVSGLPAGFTQGTQGARQQFLNSTGLAFDYWCRYTVSGELKNITSNQTIELTALDGYTMKTTQQLKSEYPNSTVDGPCTGEEVLPDNLMAWQDIQDMRTLTDADAAKVNPKSQTLNESNNWTCSWKDLPTEGTQNGKRALYRYYPIETSADGSFDITYTVNGKSYAQADMPGVDSGFVHVNNQEVIRPELPMTGSFGIECFLYGGSLLTASSTAVGMWKYRQGRKGGKHRKTSK